jgi:hypothetical protein
MKDLILDKDAVKAPIEIKASIPDPTESKLVARLIKKKGHQIFKMDMMTLLIDQCGDEDYIKVVNFEDQNTTHKINMKKDHLYCSALNKKNAIKRFGEMMADFFSQAANNIEDDNSETWVEEESE